MHFFLAAHPSHSEPREFCYFDHMAIEYLFVVEREFSETNKWFVSNRRSHRKCFINEGVFKNFAKFRGKHLCWNRFLRKLQASDLQLC